MYFKEGVYLQKGRLMSSEWNADLQAYDQVDVTKYFKRFLMRNCELAPGTTLKHIIEFVENDLDFWTQTVTSYLPLFVKESKKKDEIKEDLNLKFLELYFTPESTVSGDKKELSGMIFPHFHAKGFPEKDEEIPFGESADGLINYSLSFLRINQFVDLTLVLNKELIITEIDDKERSYNSLPGLGNPEYSLMGIIYAIFWELSFYGSPTSRNSQAKKILGSIKSVKRKLKKTKGKKSV